MKPSREEPRIKRGFSPGTALAAGLTVGTTLAFLQALHFRKPAISFEFSVWTIIAFLAGFDIAYASFRFLFRFGDRASRCVRRVGSANFGLLFLAAIAVSIPAC